MSRKQSIPLHEAVKRYAMPEAEIVRTIDAIVVRRLATDREFRYAETADAQAEREREITEQVEREVRHGA
jgi:hypothetical protein